jgi:hypothetical protein
MTSSIRLSSWLPFLAVAVLLLGGWMVAGDDDAGDRQPNDRQADIELSEFMRRKLEASSQILEGLCTEDAALIRQGTVLLQELGAAEKWRVSTDPMYRQFSGDFQEIIQQMSQAADEENYDRVALKWMDATMCCIDCHRFTRSMLIVDGEVQ